MFTTVPYQEITEFLRCKHSSQLTEEVDHFLNNDSFEFDRFYSNSNEKYLKSSRHNPQGSDCSTTLGCIRHCASSITRNKTLFHPIPIVNKSPQGSIIVSLQEEGSVVLSCYVTGGGEVGCGKETFVFLRIFLIGVSSVVLVSATLDDCSSTIDSSIPLAPFGTKALYLVSDIL